MLSSHLPRKKNLFIVNSCLGEVSSALIVKAKKRKIQKCIIFLLSPYLFFIFNLSYFDIRVSFSPMQGIKWCQNKVSNSELIGQETAMLFLLPRALQPICFVDILVSIAQDESDQGQISWKNKVPCCKLFIILHTNTLLQCSETWKRLCCDSCCVHPQVEIILIPEIFAVHKIPDVL